MSNTIEAEVAIVGAGPCGVTLANYLGAYGIETVVLERNDAILDYPRAVGADDEALRSWQGVGLAEPLLKDMIQNVPARYYNSKGWCFAEVSPGEQPFGWPRRNLFIQPMIEHTLREGLARFSHVRVMLGTEVAAMNTGKDQVELQAQGGDDTRTTVRAKYVVGSDGGRSTIRTLAGIQLTGKTHTNKWLVIDVLNDPLDAPYTAIHCHPRQPHISIHLPYGYRRFEFQVDLETNDDEVLAPDNLERLLRPLYSGIDKLPEIKRARVYLHHSRIADRFRHGRVFVAGDAAHLQPPFFGQGMNSGLRDATNLSWKLAWVLRGKAHERILDSYESERRDHALKMVNFATWIGSTYKPHSRFTEFCRDQFFRLIRGLPGAKAYILQLKFKPMSRYEKGVVLPLSGKASRKSRKENPVGRLFLQPSVEDDRGIRKLDDAIGPRFALIGIEQDPDEILDTDVRTALGEVDCQTVFIRPSKSIRHRPGKKSSSLVAEDVHGKFRDWRLKHPEWRFLLLRPDRYVAAVTDAANLNDTMRRFLKQIR